MTTMTMLMGLGGHACEADSLQPVKGFPADEAGIEHGVSACYAGALGSELVMAGGCNFPVNTLAPDSRKRYYKGIYVAHAAAGSDELDWRLAGWMPEAMAYGVTVVCDDGLVLVGGTGEDGSQRAVSRISLKDRKAQVSQLPPLPCTADNMAGAMVGRRLYVAGGFMDGRAGNRVLRLDMDHLAEGWQEVRPFPGIARVQPVAGSMGAGRFCLFGGFAPGAEGKEAELAMGGCVYDEAADAWRLLDGPTDAAGCPLFVGGGAAVNLTADSLLVMGGVNKDVFLSAVNHPQPDYLSHPVEWYRFNPYTLLYHDGRWTITGKSQATARAGAALAATPQGVFVIGGELKPRVRSNEIYRLSGSPSPIGKGADSGIPL